MKSYFFKISAATFPDFLNNSRFPSFDGIRAISISAVILGHLLPENVLTKFFTGRWGVQFFFVISGFLITTLLIKEIIIYNRFSVKRFWARRVIRIFPVAYLYIAVLFALDVLLSLNIPRDSFLSAGLYVMNLPIFHERESWYFDHFWSLSTEEQYYLYFPFVLLSILSCDIKLMFYFLIPLALLFVYILTQFFDPYFFNYLVGLNLGLFVGSVVAVLVGGNIINIPKIRGFYLISLMILTCFLTSDLCAGFPNLPILLLTSTLMAVVLVSSIQYNSGWYYMLLNNRLITQVGLMSYSLYIWHQPFTRQPIFGDFGLGHNLGLFVNFLLIVLISLASFHLFEKRILKYKSLFSGSVNEGDSRSKCKTV